MGGGEAFANAEELVVAGRRLALYDLSSLVSNATSRFEPNPHAIEYVDSRATVAVGEQTMGIPPDAWPDGHAWNAETVTIHTHSGTHVDAPHHYGPPVSGHARTIDEVPLRWCFGPGVLLDMRRKGPGGGITRADVVAELDRIGHALEPLDIVLVMTGASRWFEQPGYELRHPGLRRDATEWLIDHGVRLIGIDAWGLDRPMDVMSAEAKAGDREQLWESHILGREKEYCQIEKLCGLEALPSPTGFTVSALPIRLEAASAAWARVVAIYELPS